MDVVVHNKSVSLGMVTQWQEYLAGVHVTVYENPVCAARTDCERVGQHHLVTGSIIYLYPEHAHVRLGAVQ